MGKYVRPAFFPELFRLAEELKLCSPNLVIALGNTAAWATMRGMTGIGDIRGRLESASSRQGSRFSPTYHPAAVLCNWSLRTICIQDFMKAKRESAFPEIRRPRREILVRPALAEIEAWYNQYAVNAQILACDVETARKQITMVGFAISPSRAIVIPFCDESGNNFWPDIESECKAWDWVQKFLSLPVSKVGQNFLYDCQYLIRHGIRPKLCMEDTMLLSHSYWPEMQKSLGFLGSIWTNESAWKLLGRRKSNDEAEKRDE